MLDEHDSLLGDRVVMLPRPGGGVFMLPVDAEEEEEEPLRMDDVDAAADGDAGVDEWLIEDKGGSRLRLPCPPSDESSPSSSSSACAMNRLPLRSMDGSWLLLAIVAV